MATKVLLPTSARVQSIVPTHVADEQTLAGPQRLRQDYLDQWQTILDRRLIEWGVHPEQLEEDDLSPPSREAIQGAWHIAKVLRSAGQTPPLHAVPTGDGGIALEWKDGSRFTMVEISAEGTAELMIFNNYKLCYRNRIL